MSFISGKLKSSDKSEIQSFRYNKKDWTSDRAKSHCNNKDGSFEAAVKKVSKSLTPSDIPNLLIPGGNPAFQGKGEKGLAYKLCIIENKERGKTDEEAKYVCAGFKPENEEVDLEKRKIDLFAEKEGY